MDRMCINPPSPWIFLCGLIWTLQHFFGYSHGLPSQTFYMDDSVAGACDRQAVVSGATVYSHRRGEGGGGGGGDTAPGMYRDNINCRITFQSATSPSAPGSGDGGRLMLRVVDLDIPDRSLSALCNDALYVFDANNIFGKALKQAGGASGLCGDTLPPVIHSSGPYLTIYFRTDNSGPKGRGFKFIVTSYTQDFKELGGCRGDDFLCDNKKCVSRELLCDSVDHCGDFTDELSEGRAACADAALRDAHEGTASWLSGLLSLGVTAAVAVTVGSLAVVIACAVCVVCCCRRCLRRKPQESGGAPGHNTPSTHVTINNGGPTIMAQYSVASSSNYGGSGGNPARLSSSVHHSDHHPGCGHSDHLSDHHSDHMIRGEKMWSEEAVSLLQTAGYKLPPPPPELWTPPQQNGPGPPPGYHVSLPSNGHPGNVVTYSPYQQRSDAYLQQMPPVSTSSSVYGGGGYHSPPLPPSGSHHGNPPPLPNYPRPYTPTSTRSGRSHHSGGQEAAAAQQGSTQPVQL